MHHKYELLHSSIIRWFEFDSFFNKIVDTDKALQIQVNILIADILV